MLEFIQNQWIFGIVATLICIGLTAIFKKLIRDVNNRKKYTPLITLIFGIGFSALFIFLIAAEKTFNANDVQSYVNLLAFGMEISVGATGLYIAVKRIFGKNTEEDITVEDLFKTAGTYIPQGLMLVSNFLKGDIASAESVYSKVKEKVSSDLEKGVKLEDTINTIQTLINGWTNDSNVDVVTQAKLLVDSVKAELEKETKIEDTKTEEKVVSEGGVPVDIINLKENENLKVEANAEAVFVVR